MQINKTRNERREITTDITEIQTTVREYYEWSYVNILDNLEEMGKFPETYHLPSLNQEKNRQSERSITSIKIELVIKKILREKRSQTAWLHREFYQTYKEESIKLLINLKLIQKIKQEGTLPTSSYESITPIPKPEKLS